MCEDICEDIIINACVFYTITERLWYNCPIRTEQIYDLRMCEDVLMYNKRFAFIIPQNQIFYNGKQYQICSFYALAS